MSQTSETPLKYADFLNYLSQAEEEDTLGSFSDGTRVWLRLNGFWKAFLITDMIPRLQVLDVASSLPVPVAGTPNSVNSALENVFVQIDGQPISVQGTVSLSGALPTGLGITGANSAQVGAAVNGPGALATITTITPGVAAAYNIWVSAGLGGGAALAADIGNMRLRQTAGTIAILAVTPGTGYFGPFRRALSALDTLNVQSLGAGTAGVVYTATIIAIQVP